MIVVIGILVLLTIGVAFMVLAPRIAEGRLIFDVRADRPVGFGYKMAWLAVRTSDTRDVVAALDLVAPTPANWNSGIGTVYDDKLGEKRVFVSPPVDGWTFVVGLALPHPMSAAFVDKWSPVMTGLAARYGSVQYFISYPLIDFHAWAVFTKGKLSRAFAINDAGIVLNRGKPTREEKALGLKLFELRGVKGRKGDAGGEIILYPTEEHVMRLATKWSLDPTALGPASGPEGVGVVAEAPLHWRPERMRKTA